jgi:hypothetical protein
MYRYLGEKNNWVDQRDASINSGQQLRQEFKKWVEPNFKNGDVFVTLTFKPTIKFDEVKRSLDVQKFLTRLNRTVYGKAFDKGRERLNSCPIFEHNYSDGVHVHMILERPAETDRWNGRFENLVMDTWLEMDNAGVRKAQDAGNCFDVSGLIGYMTKQIKTGDKLIKLDANNLHWK